MKSTLSTNEKKWLADRLRELAAEETVIGSTSVAAAFLLRAETLEGERCFFGTSPGIDLR